MQRPTSSLVPALLSWAMGLFLLICALLLGLEGILFATEHAPITWYVRCAVGEFGGWTAAAGGVFLFGLGTLVGHFIWDARYRAAKELARRLERRP